ncbi:hypothetical protein QUA20_02350, partial [Microcoleus sp. Pol7_A1]|uniref:hypothetical protein n=1 Tax=Microcoleus sp. Pol7_A1 TaxID=2818893 RepID=UPI002FD33CF2
MVEFIEVVIFEFASLSLGVVAVASAGVTLEFVVELVKVLLSVEMTEGVEEFAVVTSVFVGVLLESVIFDVGAIATFSLEVI